MKVTPSQLVPGCVVVEDVYGKTSHPIVPKNTAVSEQHITILQKFLVKSVEVSTKLSSGAPFTPTAPIEETSSVAGAQSREKKPGDFSGLYLQTVELYKQLFTSWQGNAAVEIGTVRELISPLLDLTEEIEKELLHLHLYATQHDYFYHHSVATAILSAFLAKKNGWKDWKQAGLAGFLADCGMAKIDAHLFEKAGPLTPEEYREVKTHPTYSYRLVENIPSLPLKVKLGILQHHEKLDGTGYPLGVKEEKIHPYAKVIAVADRFHAMTSDRVYQEKTSPYKVLEDFLAEQFGKYSFPIVQTLVTSLVHFSAGTKVLLSDNQKAEIIFVDEKLPLRPMIRVEDTGEVLWLKDKKDVYIEKVR